MLNLDGQLGRIWSHGGDSSLQASVKEFPHWVSRAEKTATCEWQDPVGYSQQRKREGTQQPNSSPLVTGWMQCDQLSRVPAATSPLP